MVMLICVWPDTNPYEPPLRKRDMTHGLVLVWICNSILRQGFPTLAKLPGLIEIRDLIHSKTPLITMVFRNLVS